MDNRLFLIAKEDIVGYPPVLSIMQALLDLSVEVIFIGTYSDIEQKKTFEKKGVKFIDVVEYNVKTNQINKIRLQHKFKKEVERILDYNEVTNNDLLWIFQSTTICLLRNLFDKYRVIAHLFEHTGAQLKWKYRITNPDFSMSSTLQKAYKVICCEYNRSHIAKGIYQLEELPVVLPNKYIVEEDSVDTLPEDVAKVIEPILKKIDGKKVLIYQGIFMDKERRLEEFCQAVQFLPDEYVLIAMGRGSQMYERIKEQYESDRVIFIPFIRPPFHLQITKRAFMGIMSYFPSKSDIDAVINPIYCAPNKIFEYARYSIPMLSNDIPALHYVFKEFNCGRCVSYPITPEGIVESISYINKNYKVFSNGASDYYNSVDIKSIISRQILTPVASNCDNSKK